MEIKLTRLISEGDLENSAGGIFNPGCLAFNETSRELLVRVEPHHAYTNDSRLALLVENIAKLRAGEVDQIFNLTPIGYPPHSKLEDARLFYYKGERYAIHTMVITKRGWEDATCLKPVIGRITRSTIEFVDWVDLPYVPRKIGEKNWLPIVYEDELYILYGLDPLRIFKLKGWSWTEVKFEDTGLAKHVKEMLPGSTFLSLSAITHYEGDHYLGFWHVRHVDETYGEVYKQGMFLLNMATMRIENFTPSIMQGGGLSGFKPGCLYVSGLVATPTKIEAYAGEADSHTVLIELDREEVAEELSRHEFRYSAPLRVLFRDYGAGDFICMMYALKSWMEENKRGAKIYLYSNMQMASALKVPGVTVCQWHGEPFDIDLSSNEDSLPEDKRFTYAQKIKGSLKEWYAGILDSGLSKIDVSHILPNLEYSDAIILFPFAAKEDRCWDLKNWIMLASQLKEMGKRVVICDPFPARCVNIPGELLSGASVIDVLRALSGAAVVVSNESGGAHMAGLFETPTLVLSGNLDPRKIYDHTNNDFIYKKPLESISVEEVIEKILSLLHL